MPALALANNDVVQLFWQLDAKLDACLGFTIARIEDGGEWEPLPAWVGFQGQSNQPWVANTTDVWPVQKFSWKDVEAKRGKTYRYRIRPVTGDPASLRPLTPIPGVELLAGPVTLSPACGSFDAYFNRGILSTQFVAHAIKPGPSGAPNYRILTDRIDQPGDPLRAALAGQIIAGVSSLLTRAANDGGSCHAALYELTDPELIQALLAAKGLHIILSNTGTDDKENMPARQALHDAKIDIADRYVPSGHIGHNKFMVYSDAAGTPKAVLLGSTNWTDTGLCAQSNNALVANDPALAQAYRDYWDRLRADTPADGRSPQGPDLRHADAQPGAADLPIDDGKATIWFSPNMPRARQSKPPPNESAPPDLQQVFALMEGAQQAILFLAFEPGSPSIVEKAAAVANAKPGLYIRGAVTDPKAAGIFNTALIHKPGQAPDEVVPASAITDQFAFWQQELLKSGPEAHAIIHDKIIVIDPLSPDCVVVTGSHNLGYRASYNNDENMLIVRGHGALAKAYATHVLDIYDHYRFRFMIQKNGTNAFSGLLPNDSWQDRYFDPTDSANSDMNAWFA